ncbi:Hypothetical predicted protein, partial [Podarcis lilfordi]
RALRSRLWPASPRQLPLRSGKLLPGPRARQRGGCKSGGGGGVSRYCGLSDAQWRSGAREKEEEEEEEEGARRALASLHPLLSRPAAAAAAAAPGGLRLARNGIFVPAGQGR